jgi:chondroitin AC lyase
MTTDGGNLELRAENVEGSWNWVARQYPDERINADLFRLWFDHGKNPQSRSYEYILIPGADKEQLENFQTGNPIKIKNDKNIQAVFSNDKAYKGIVFYRAGKFAGDPGIEVNKPCVMMLKHKPEGWQISISDPTQIEKEIQITLSGKYKHNLAEVEGEKTKLTLPMPQGGEAGKTMTLVLSKN